MINASYHYQPFVEFDRRVRELEAQRQYGTKRDPERPPPREPGDGYIIFGLVVGAIAGIALGAAIALYFDFLSNVIGLVSGGIAGGVIGTIIGGEIKKRIIAKRRHKDTVKREVPAHDSD
ncbi:MAG: hypothetical protein ABIH70_02505 [Chloroflexota bacterium]